MPLFVLSRLLSSLWVSRTGSASDWCALQEALYKCIDTIQYNTIITKTDSWASPIEIIYSAWNWDLDHEENEKRTKKNACSRQSRRPCTSIPLWLKWKMEMRYYSPHSYCLQSVLCRPRHVCLLAKHLQSTKPDVYVCTHTIHKTYIHA